MQHLIKFSTHACKLDYREITFIQKNFKLREIERFFDISALSVYFNSNHLAVIVMTEITFEIMKLLCCEPLFFTKLVDLL